MNQIDSNYTEFIQVSKAINKQDIKVTLQFQIREETVSYINYTSYTPPTFRHRREHILYASCCPLTVWGEYLVPRVFHFACMYTPKQLHIVISLHVWATDLYIFFRILLVFMKKYYFYVNVASFPPLFFICFGGGVLKEGRCRT